MSDPIIKVEQVSKMYELGVIGSSSLRETMTLAAQKILRRKKSEEEKEFWALRDINFEINQGDVLGIVGRNGAGKSTLLKVLSRITEPTKGRITLKGRVASLLEVGTGFHPELTGRENVFLNGSILGMTRQEIRSKFDEIVAFSGVEKFLDTPVKRYSSGMYVRLAFAVAAHLEPEILVIDEVLSVGDAEFQAKCIGKMGEVSKSGRTVLFVSHNMAAVRQLCTRGILLKQGQLVAQGGADEIVDMYLKKDSELTDIPINERSDSINKNFDYFEFNLLNEKGMPLEFVQSGQSVVLSFKYKSRKDLDNVNLKIFLYDSFGNCLSILNNRLSNKHTVNLPREGEIECEIPNIPLNIGEYYLNIEVKSHKQIMYSLETFTKLTVIDGGFFPTGKLPSKEVKFLLNHNWNVNATV